MPVHTFSDTLILAVIACLRLDNHDNTRQEISSLIAGAYKASLRGEDFPVPDEEVQASLRTISNLPLQYRAASIAAVLSLLDKSVSLPSCERVVEATTEELDLAVSLSSSRQMADTISHVCTDRQGVLPADIVWNLSVACRTEKMLTWLQGQIKLEKRSQSLGDLLALRWNSAEELSGLVREEDFCHLWDTLASPKPIAASCLTLFSDMPRPYLEVLLKSFDQAVGDGDDLVRKVLASNLTSDDKLHVVNAIVLRYSSSDATAISRQEPLQSALDEDVPLVRRPRARRPATIPTPPASDVETATPGIVANVAPSVPQPRAASEVGDRAKRLRSPEPVGPNKRRNNYAGRSTTSYFNHEELYFIFTHGLRGQRGMKMEWGECIRKMKATFGKGYDHDSQARVSKVYSQLKRELYGIDVYSEAFDELVEMEDAEPDFAAMAERLEKRFCRKFAVEELRRVYHVRYEPL